MLEGSVGTKNLGYKHVCLFCDNTAAVTWIKRGAAKKSAASGRLLRILYLRQRVARVSLLVAAHVGGDLNVPGDIPYFSFGYSKQWYCTKYYEFISLINYQLPLPHHRSWQGF